VDYIFLFILLSLTYISQCYEMLVWTSEKRITCSTNSLPNKW